MVEDISIIGKNQLDAKTMADYVVRVNPHPNINCTIDELAQIFIEEGKDENVRGDIAFCQACKETGWFRFGGQVLPEQNNYAGIGALNEQPIGKGAWFDTPRDGVRAQIQHLKGYASTDYLYHEIIDPRYHLLKRLRKLGTRKTWKSLSGAWAYPGYDKSKYANINEATLNNADYGSTILLIYEKMRDSNALYKWAEEHCIDVGKSLDENATIGDIYNILMNLK